MLQFGHEWKKTVTSDILDYTNCSSDRKEYLIMNIVMNLQGQWQFCLDKEKKGLNAHYELLTLKDTITLPSTVSEAGKGSPHDRNDTGHLTDPYEMEGYSWYQKTLSLPVKEISALSGKHFELTLERTRISYVWVDGRFAGRWGI